MDFPRGKVVAVMGGSGSGKTTILRLIGGQLAPQQGKVTVDGKIVHMLLIMDDEPFAGLDPISMGVTANLIRKLNDALGSTSILVTHDVHESFAIADYVYFLSQGNIVAQGTPEEMLASGDPFVHQFVHAE